MLVDWGFGDVSFLARLGVLLVVLGAILAWDYRRHGAKGTRWREYLFLVAVGLLGAGIGVAHDLVTSSISEDYFVIGKGMNKGVGFRSSVIELGAHAGFLAAVVGAGIYLLANGRRDGTSPLSLGRLARLVWKPLACALLGAAVLGGLATAVPPDGALRLEFVRGLSMPERARFVRVWGIHIGVYGGLLLGMVWGVLSIRSCRRAAMANDDRSAAGSR
jgi:hypothetical protein